jgi:diacylglycerol diphosphate phosphatase / phosphatidate phosphatase
MTFVASVSCKESYLYLCQELLLMVLPCSLTRLWPHAYFRGILEPEGGTKFNPNPSTDNSLPNGSFHSLGAVEMRTTSYALESTEAGQRTQ